MCPKKMNGISFIFENLDTLGRHVIFYFFLRHKLLVSITQQFVPENNSFT